MNRNKKATIEEFPKEERAYPEAGWGEPKSDKLFVLVCNGWYLMDEDFDLFRDPWNFKGTLTDDVRYALYLPDDIHCLSKATVVFREAFEDTIWKPSSSWFRRRVFGRCSSAGIVVSSHGQ